MRVASLVNAVRRFWHGRAVEVFHRPAYRLAVPGVGGGGECEPRGADFALWYLLASGALAANQVLRPRRVTYEELARVHTPELLDGLSRAEKLSAVFAVDPADVRVDEVLGTFRLACGGTLLAAQACLDPERPRPGRRMLNLFGGFHHAGPARAGGVCPLNHLARAGRGPPAHALGLAARRGLWRGCVARAGGHRHRVVGGDVPAGAARLRPAGGALQLDRAHARPRGTGQRRRLQFQHGRPGRRPGPARPAAQAAARLLQRRGRRACAQPLRHPRRADPAGLRLVPHRDLRRGGGGRPSPPLRFDPPRGPPPPTPRGGGAGAPDRPRGAGALPPPSLTRRSGAP